MTGIPYVAPTETVALPDGSKFTVRGLSPEDVGVLVRNYYDALNDLFNTYVKTAAKASASNEAPKVAPPADIAPIVLNLSETAPRLVAHAIALAAEEPDVDKAKQLGLGIQIDAITKVLRLTLEAEGGLEKLMESVSRLADSAAGGLRAGRSPSTDGSRD